MMARAAAAPPSAPSAATACGMPARSVSILRLTPITPVEATSTCSTSQPTRGRRQLRHLPRVGHALRAGAGVGAAAVGDDGARASRRWRRGDPAQTSTGAAFARFEREHAGRACAGASLTMSDEVGLAAGLDAAVQAAGAEAGRRGDAARDRRAIVSHGERSPSPRAVRAELRDARRVRAIAGPGRWRTGRSCGTAGTNGSRARSSRAPRCAARSRTRAARRTPGRARTRTGASKPSRRARRPSSSTMRWPRPSWRASRLTTSERTSATAPTAARARRSRRCDRRPPTATATTKRAHARAARRACAAAGGLLRGAPRSARAAPARRRRRPRASVIAGGGRSTTAADAPAPLPGPLSTTTRIVTLSPRPSILDLTDANAPSRMPTASSISASDTVSGGSIRTTRSAVRFTSRPAFSAASTTGCASTASSSPRIRPAPRTRGDHRVLALQRRAAAARTARPIVAMCGAERVSCSST